MPDIRERIAAVRALCRNYNGLPYDVDDMLFDVMQHLPALLNAMEAALEDTARLDYAIDLFVRQESARFGDMTELVQRSKDPRAAVRRRIDETRRSDAPGG